jgi:hypothetical protein
MEHLQRVSINAASRLWCLAVPVPVSPSRSSGSGTAARELGLTWHNDRRMEHPRCWRTWKKKKKTRQMMGSSKSQTVVVGRIANSQNDSCLCSGQLGSCLSKLPGSEYITFIFSDQNIQLLLISKYYRRLDCQALLCCSVESLEVTCICRCSSSVP